MPKKKEVVEEVQQYDITELINYVNYIGTKVEEIGQIVQSPNTKFGLEQIDTESQVGSTKFFHTVVSESYCSKLSNFMKEFYLQKYGSSVELSKPDFYAF